MNKTSLASATMEDSQVLSGPPCMEALILAKPTNAEDPRTETDNEGSDVADNQSIVSDGSENSDGSEDSVDSEDSDASEMEPFKDYLPKIEQLLGDIGFPSCSVEPLHHGYTFQNNVYGLRSAEDGSGQYILRVPVCSYMVDGKSVAIENDAALLGYLGDKLPVPCVKAYSATADNALNAPFMVQTRLRGQPLDDVYDNLAHEDKLSIVDKFVELLSELESNTFPMAGTFTAPLLLPVSTRDFHTTGIPVISIFSKGDDEFVKDSQVLQDRTGSDLKSFLVSHIDGWIQKETRDDESTAEWRSFILPLYRQLSTIVDELENEGALKDGPYPVVLHHWDLEPRNIMVDDSSGSWKISGIIDWDDALALPRPLTRRPPDWIWEIDGEPGFEGYLNNDHHPNDNISDEGRKLKAHFDAKAADALSNYMEDAYGSGRWLRRIWTFARSGADGTWYIDLMKQLLKDWEERSKPPAV